MRPSAEGLQRAHAWGSRAGKTLNTPLTEYEQEIHRLIGGGSKIGHLDPDRKIRAARRRAGIPDPVIRPDIDWHGDEGSEKPKKKRHITVVREPKVILPFTKERTEPKERKSRATGVGQGNRTNHPKKTHCPQGHPYAGSNLLLRLNGQNSCRTCNRDSSRQAYRLAHGIPLDAPVRVYKKQTA